MRKPLRAAKLVIAALLLVRLGGYGRAVLPPAAWSLAALLALLLYEAVAHSFARRGETLSAAAVRRWAAARTFPLALAAVTAAALALRLYGITRDLGHVALGVDEHRLNASVLHLFATGEIDYRTVEHYPGIHYWMLVGTYLLAYVWGLMRHLADTFAAMPAEHFAAFGRVVSALQSTATVLLTGLLGRRLAGPRAGVLAAGVLALAPLSVSLGRQLRNDASVTLFTVAAVLVAMAVQQPGSRSYEALLGGTLAGLAAGIKYTGVFALVPVLLAAALCEERTRRVRAAALVLCGFAVAALLSNHFVWADLPNLVDQLSDQIMITGAGHWAAQDNPSLYHVTILAQRAVGWPLLLLAGAATAYHLAAGSRRWWVFSSFPLIYLWFVAQRPSQLPRWVYPEAPFAAVAACAGLAVVTDLVAQRVPATRGALPRRLAPPLIALLLLLPLLSAAALELNRRLAPPTYTVAERWLEDNVAAGDRVLMENRWLQLDRRRYRVEHPRSLDEVLAGGLYELAAYDWIVVQEELFAHPALAALVRTKLVAVDPTFFGNQGPNFAVYRPPSVPPAPLPLAVSFAEPASARYLGHRWPRRADAAGERLLPEAGAGLFLPPLGTAGLRLDLVVAPPAEGEAPPAIVASAGTQQLAVQRTDDEQARATVFSIDLSRRIVGPRIVALQLRPAPGSGPVRVRGFRLR